MTYKTPITIYVVHHADCDEARDLSKTVFDWFRLSDFSSDSASAGIPVYYRRCRNGETLVPAIDWDAARLNVVILLVDHRMVLDECWRKATIGLANEIVAQRQKAKDNGSPKQPQPGESFTPALLLPVALHESFYRLHALYENFNPVRLLNTNKQERAETLRRAITEATARALRTTETTSPPPLNVFLSHAKADGTEIALAVRDGIQSFGQMIAWYDANDLPHGGEWSSPMEEAAAAGTASMIAVVTDAYPTRPWCREEVTLARSPRELAPKVWGVQPMLAVHQPKNSWARDVPMLGGVPRIGWNSNEPTATALIVDRLALEILLKEAHRKMAEVIVADADDGLVCITWVPDTWTLLQLNEKIGDTQSVRRIAFPGHGLSTLEKNELASVLNTFAANPELVPFEEALS